MVVNDVKLRSCHTRRPAAGVEAVLPSMHRRPKPAARCFAAALVAGAALLLQAVGADAQPLPAADCLTAGQPLLGIPELITQAGKLTGTMVLRDELRRLTLTAGSDCAQVYLRFFEGVNATPFPGTPPGPPPKYKDPLPGPTLRARVGDIVQLTFLNHVDPLNYGGSLDRGADAGACDQFSAGSGGVGAAGYPANVGDTYPNCFHGSSTANIHFHGTHTNPNSTGDNVFLQIRPSPRSGGQPIVNAASVEGPFKTFFDGCEAKLKADPLSQYPFTWKDLPETWTTEQRTLLQAYDKGQPPYSPPAKPPAQQLWPENQKQLDKKPIPGWPQYYVGAYPHCFTLPEYKAPRWPMPGARPRMGQAPGTHWYHAHKHGSTALNVSNGMTGAFIIEGKYDDDLNGYYGTVTVGTPPQRYPWTRVQPVLVLNQLGQSSNLERNTPLGPLSVSVNGRLQPTFAMRPGEVQLWRIVNTSSRTAAYLVGPPKLDPTKPTVDPTTDFEWRQLAQDGVQFADPNYQQSHNQPLMIASGNRADLLVKAPTRPGAAPYNVVFKPVVSQASVAGTAGTPLMSVTVGGTAPDNPRQRTFLPRAPLLPPFLADITDAEVNGKGRTLVFNSKPPTTPLQHTINNHQFGDADAMEAVFLNAVEEWKIVNDTAPTVGAGNIDHPFHIHINPFQVVEVFDPNETVFDPKSRTQVAKYVTTTPVNPEVQCQIDLTPNSPTWRDCHNKKERYGIWWDVFPIPTGKYFQPEKVVVPGFFKMRSRFVDFAGDYVLHCHILAHEDRGMMFTVHVRPLLLPELQHH